MMFLNGLLAGFAVLGAVPIIIHLLNKSRFRVVEWGAMAFILKTLQKNSRRVQFRDLILMLLRTFAIIFAALAMARPTITDTGFAGFGMGGGIHAVIVLDNGMSMQYSEGNENRYERGVTVAKTILDGLPNGSSAILVLASDVASAEVSEPTQDLAYLHQLLEKSIASDGGSNITAALGAAWDILEPVSGGREIYLVTDLQTNGWADGEDRAMRDLIGRMQAADGLRLYVADVGSAETANVSVDRLAFVDDMVGTDAPATVVVTLRNHGDAPVSQVPVDLYVGEGADARPAASTVVDHIDRTAQVRLEARFEKGGRQRLEVRIGPDALPADNQRRMVIDVVDKIQVLVIDGGEGQTGNESATFIRAALTPEALLDNDEAAVKDGSRFAVTVVSPAQLIGVRLEDFQAVILSDVAQPTPALADALAAFVNSGKGLLTLLGPSISPDVYNAEFVTRQLLPGLLPLESKSFVPKDDDQAPGISFSTESLVHPIVSMFATKENQPFLTQPRLRRAWPLTIPVAEVGVAPLHSPILQAADGTVVATQSNVGRGHAVTLGMGADRRWSDLPLRPAFLMVMRRTLQHIAVGDRSRLNVMVHEPIVQAVSPRDAGSRFAVTQVDGIESSVSPVTRENGDVRVEYAETPRAGFVRLALDTRTWDFAINSADMESDVRRLSEEDVTARLSPLVPVLLSSGQDVATRLEQGRFGKKIWPILFALALACLIAETVLALRWAPRGA